MKPDVKAIIDKLISNTKDGKLSWVYIDVDVDVDVFSRVDDLILYNINTNTSFFCKVAKGYFVLVEIDNTEPPALLLISIPQINSRDHRVLNSYDKYQQELLRLQNLVKKQYPNSDDFLEEFLKS